MVNDSWALLTGESDQWPSDTVELTGKITTMDSQILGFYKQQLSQAGVTTEYFKQIYELTLDATESRLSKFLYLGFFLLLAICCILGALGSRKQMKNVEDIQAIARENAADPSLNPFLNGGSATANPYATGGQTDTANPYAASMNATGGTNPYGAAGTEASANPYENAAANPYGTDTPIQDSQAQGASFPGASSSEDDTTVLITPDSATSDSYNSDSYTPQ